MLNFCRFSTIFMKCFEAFPFVTGEPNFICYISQKLASEEMYSFFGNVMVQGHSVIFFRKSALENFCWSYEAPIGIQSSPWVANQIILGFKAMRSSRSKFAITLKWPWKWRSANIVEQYLGEKVLASRCQIWKNFSDQSSGIWDISQWSAIFADFWQKLYHIFFLIE